MTIRIPDTDREFERVTIAKVSPSGDGWVVQQEGGWSLSYPDTGITPEVGDVVRYYGRGIGYTVRGIMIEGKGVVRYESKSEQRARFDSEQAARDQEKQEALERELPDRDMRIRELRPALRERIKGFQAARPLWRRDHEPYELFVCEQAEAFATHFEDDENAVLHLNDWTEMGEPQQRALIPAMSDQHSGNTFGSAVQIARLLLLGSDDMVPKIHGALCPLVGCEEYGCVPAR